MPIRIVPPPVKKFILVESDEQLENDGEPTVVFIRPAVQGDEEMRNRLFTSVTSEYVQDAIVSSSTLSIDDLRRVEVFLTLADSNLLGYDGKPLFLFENERLSTTEFEFDKVWGQLPNVIAEEIIRYVLEVNQQWTVS